MATGGRNATQYFAGVEVRVAWGIMGDGLKQYRQSSLADESQVVLTKHRGFFTPARAISTVR